MERILFRADHYDFEPQALLFFGAMFGIWFCGFVILNRVRPGRTRELVFLHIGILTFWLLARGCARLAVDPDYILFWYRVAYAVIPLGLAMIYNYIMHAAGLEYRRRFWIRLVWLCALVLAVTPSAWRHDNVIAIARFSWGFEPVHGWMATLMTIMVFFMAIGGTTDLVKRCRETPADTDEGKRIRGVTLATGFLLFSYADFLVGEGIPVYPIGVFAVLAFFTCVAWVTVRFGLVDVTSEVAADRIVGIVNTAMLVVDRDGNIRVANDAASRMLDESSTALAKTNLNTLFDRMPSLRRFEHDWTEDSLNDITVTRTVHEQEREYRLSISVQRNPRGVPQAFVCLLRDLTQELREEKERIEASLRDPLTGLPGRQTFLEYVDLAIRDVNRGRTPCGVLFLSVDRFRNINEEISFAAGDEILIKIARRLTSNLGTRDMVARVGGDEFAVLLESGYRDEVLAADAEKVMDMFSGPLDIEGHSIHLSVSIGAALPSPDCEDAVQLMRNAAMAMHAAKSEGGGRYCLYDSDKHSESGEIALEQQIREGLQRNEFVPYYQPIYNLENGTIIGFEALARWQHRDRGVLGAYEFIEFAEASGLIDDIGRSIQGKVFSDMRALNSELNGSSPYVSVNISDHEFRHPDFVSRFSRQVREAGLKPEQVCLEITERMVMLDPGDERLEALSRGGYRLFIDDFGTGYSSMTRLHSLPLHTLKIDRQFVLEMGKSESGEKLIEGIINLARILGLNVIAEGVGESYEAEKLRRYHCPYVQGFHFGKPMPFEQARAEYLEKGEGEAVH